MWRRPEGLAAIVNSILVVLIPIGVVLVVSLGVESGNTVHASGLQHTLSLECIAKLTDRPLVLRFKAWYGRLTDEAVSDDPGLG